MSKENLKEYFRHDYHARDHVKFKPMKMEMGMEGMGIYWSIVEMLYEEGGSIMRSHCDSIAFDLRIDKTKLMAVLESYKLFEFDEKKFWSPKVITRLKERSEKSKKAAKSAKKRWNEMQAKAMRSHSEGNAIREENRIEENRRDILLPFGEDFKTVWKDWEQYKKEKKQKLTPSTIKLQLKRLAKHPEPVAIEMIKQSIDQGWQGIFELKTNGKKIRANPYKLQ